MAVDYFREVGYEHADGAQIAPDSFRPEQADCGRLVVVGRREKVRIQLAGK